MESAEHHATHRLHVMAGDAHHVHDEGTKADMVTMSMEDCAW